MRLVQIKDKFHCDYVEYLPSDLLDISKQIEISEEDLLAIGVSKCFDVVNNSVIDYDNTEDLKKQKNTEEYFELQNFMKETDYISNKLSEAVSRFVETGDNTDVIVLRSHYKEILEKREDSRKKIDELKMLLNI